MPARATWAIVPAKRFDRAKTRLSCVLETAQRAALARAMFDDLIDALAAVAAIDAICVVSDDAALVRDGGRCQYLYDPDGGTLNDAVQLAVNYAVAHGAAACCILHADLPLASGGRIAALLDGHRGGVTLVPDRHRAGTNVMVCTPGDALPFCYGPRSLDAHRAAAVQRGIACSLVEDDALGLDLDDCADLCA